MTIAQKRIFTPSIETVIWIDFKSSPTNINGQSEVVMKGRIWITRALAAALALGGIVYAGFVYKQQFTREQPTPPVRKVAQATKLPSPKPSPATRPTTNPVSKKVIAATRPVVAQKEQGETERIDPWHPSKPNDPFRITRATRHIDGPTDTVRAAVLSRDKTRL